MHRGTQLSRRHQARQDKDRAYPDPARAWQDAESATQEPSPEMSQTPSPRALELVVALRRIDTRELVPWVQPLREFQAQPSPLLLLPSVGFDLLGLLQNDLDVIRIDEATKELRVSQLIVDGPQATVARILGRVAEALIVGRCNADPELNRRWAMYARRGRRAVSSVDRYRAVGTGLASTETSQGFGHYYSPGDTQRDVIWVAPSDNLLQMVGGTAMASLPAGLQLKAGRTLAPTIAQDIRKNVYQVPIVFFDLADDFPALAAGFVSEVQKNQLLRGRDVDPEAHELLRHYEAVLNFWMSQNGFIRDAFGDPLLASALKLSLVGA